MLRRNVWNGGPGGATTRALSRLRSGVNPATCGDPEDRGNGAATRAYPVALLSFRDEVLRVAELQARVTHGHPAAITAAQAIAVIVYDALSGRAPSLDPPPGINEETFVATWRAMHRDLIVGGPLPTRLRNIAMSGWATVAGAHAIVATFDGDPARAIAAAAGSGGDTATVGTIVGAIVGARYGLRAIPRRWVAGLQPRELVEAAIDACNAMPAAAADSAHLPV
jgi:ADP-ribosylglycohydrolase